ncbi:MAG: hypothetical protein DRJ42_07830 [Deltaproteobacteria bacterium]|nr:MAG: hypothetical protein DRJ42_07830 [Deltaproteobacteria bacterium]
MLPPQSRSDSSAFIIPPEHDVSLRVPPSQSPLRHWSAVVVQGMPPGQPGQVPPAPQSTAISSPLSMASAHEGIRQNPDRHTIEVQSLRSTQP